jgi:DNA-binding MarR family transcriptional regulator
MSAGHCVVNDDRQAYDRAMPDIAQPSVAVDGGRPLSSQDPRLTAWRAFLAAHALVWRRLDEDLRVEAGMSLAEYSALLQLAEAPDRRLRMNQLADGVFLSRSGVTRLIDRLEADGLVARSQCSSDGRGAEAVLTDAGLARLRAASPIHLRGIETNFLARITPAELAVVERALGSVAERIRCDGRPLGANCDPPADAAGDSGPA